MKVPVAPAAYTLCDARLVCRRKSQNFLIGSGKCPLSLCRNVRAAGRPLQRRSLLGIVGFGEDMEAPDP